MTTSVIIATYNRARLLDECLAHLARQQFEPGDEIIVVNNGSSDDTADVIAWHRQKSPVRLVALDEECPGKSRALTRALAVAAGDILAFTDDDINVESRWLEGIRSAMADDTVALVGGRVAPQWEQSPPRWLRLATARSSRMRSPLALVDYGAEPAALGSRTAPGGNLAIRRAALARIGGFAAHLGKLRGTLRSGEDHDLCQRCVAAGLEAVYWPAARVTHWVPADRMRIQYFLRWFFWSGIT